MNNLLHFRHFFVFFVYQLLWKTLFRPKIHQKFTFAHQRPTRTISCDWRNGNVLKLFKSWIIKVICNLLLCLGDGSTWWWTECRNHQKISLMEHLHVFSKWRWWYQFTTLFRVASTTGWGRHGKTFVSFIWDSFSPRWPIRISSYQANDENWQPNWMLIEPARPYRR